MKIKEIVRKVEETVVGNLARYANDREVLPACGDDPGGHPHKAVPAQTVILNVSLRLRPV